MAETSSNGHKHHRRKEYDELEDSEHRREAKRMRTYSDADAAEAKRRTRAMDKAEADQVNGDLSPEEWRKEQGITIQGHGSERSTKDFAAPFLHFTDAPFDAKLQTALGRAGFSKPTAIQSQCWPLALQGKDLISIAKTGSGKTCGFLLPAFHMHMQKQERRQGFAKPVLLVLAPTRELSVQIMEEAQKFGRPIGMRSISGLQPPNRRLVTVDGWMGGPVDLVMHQSLITDDSIFYLCCCYGGAPKGPQIGALERGVECIIATPG
eukprot:scaffold1663_cov171-Amphora_coffeaeformis.AAC.1